MNFFHAILLVVCCLDTIATTASFAAYPAKADDWGCTLATVDRRSEASTLRCLRQAALGNLHRRRRYQAQQEQHINFRRPSCAASLERGASTYAEVGAHHHREEMTASLVPYVGHSQILAIVDSSLKGNTGYRKG